MVVLAAAARRDGSNRARPCEEKRSCRCRGRKNSVLFLKFRPSGRRWPDHPVGPTSTINRGGNGAPLVRSLPLLLGRWVGGAARPMAAVAVVGHALGPVAPIRVLPLIERAARAQAAVAVVGHALGDGLLLRRGGGDGQSGHAQRDTETRKGEQANDHGSPPSAVNGAGPCARLAGSDYCP